MITVEEAAQVIRKFIPGGVRLARDISCDRAYPPFDRAMMDGIALDFDTYQSGRREFLVEGICPAGEPSKEIRDQSCCLEVMTGAPLPKGTDLVIQYEHIKIEQGVARIVLEIPRQRHESVHLLGSDCKKGELILREGAVLNGPHAGIAASVGQYPVPLNAPRAMIISTGNELVDGASFPLPHQIRRSNVYALKTSLEINGYSDIVLDHLDDDPSTMAAHYEKHAPYFDMMIYSGGVSKGKFDYLPRVWAQMGVQKHFHEVSQRPGKPLWFGTDSARSTVVLGLPGNPISSLVCLHRYVLTEKKMFARLTEDLIFAKDLTCFLPVKVEFERDAILMATPLKVKNSGEFTALAGSDGFIELPREKSIFKSGEAFSFYPWRNF